MLRLRQGIPSASEAKAEMNESSDETHNDTRSGWFFSRATLVACIALTTVGALLLTGHKAHLLGFAPYLLLLACPLMHLFMHGGHRGHDEQGHSRRLPAGSHGNPATTQTQTLEDH